MNPTTGTLTADRDVRTSGGNCSWVVSPSTKGNPGSDVLLYHRGRVGAIARPCEVKANTSAHYSSNVVRRTTHEPPPDSQWSGQGAFEEGGTALVSHEGILALKDRKDVNTHHPRIHSSRSVVDSRHTCLSAIRYYRRAVCHLVVTNRRISAVSYGPCLSV